MFLACVIAMSLASRDLFAVTYLKASAPDGGDGTSWDSAFNDVGQAVAAAAAAEDKTVYAAGGVYVVRASMLPPDGFKIYGGFPGLSADETPGDRDVERYRTILTADTGLDNVWCHVAPVFGGYGSELTRLDDHPVFSADGALNLPPPYDGEFDAYCAKEGAPGKDAKDCECFHIGAGVSSSYDGLWFVCFGLSGYKPTISIADAAGRTDVADCRFIGCVASQGVVQDNSGNGSGVTSIVRCQFRFNRTEGQSRAAGVATRGRTLVEDCLFEGMSRDQANGGGVIYFWSGKGAMIRRCVFSRGVFVSNTAWTEESYGGPGSVVSSEGGTGSFVDCVISNTFSASKWTLGAPTFAPRGSAIIRCSFVNNRYEVKPVAGRAYVLFGCALASGHSTTYEGCTFRGNVIAAPEVAAASGFGYCLGILGNASDGNFLATVNCTFDSNRAEHAAKEGVTAVLSRALVSYAPKSATKSQLGVANCTFAGPRDGALYDIVQYGHSHSCPLEVVNSVFTGGRAPEASPFFTAAPGLVSVRDCVIGGMAAPPAGLAVTGFRGDEVPFVREDIASVSHVPVLLPAAKTPGIRESADVATNTPPVGWKIHATYRYRPRGESAWAPLLSAEGVAVQTEALPIADANGNAREFGSFTRGAAQPLAGDAEGGVSLVLRTEPSLGGTLSSPSTQSVPAGGAIDPVVATPVDEATFLGWFREDDGTLFSGDATLRIDALDADLVLVARFETPSRAVTFELGEAGVFETNSDTSVTVLVPQGGLFPEPPPFGKDPSRIFEGWAPGFPVFVPPSNMTFRAMSVSREVRVIRVVPQGEVPAGSDRSGDSWENATDDLLAAYVDAGRYRGQVWMKRGVYKTTSPVSALSNVAVIGGFAGNEASAGEADPAANPTVISGDVNGDTYWMPNGVNPSADRRTPLWTGTTFNEPNPDGADAFWKPGGNSGDDSVAFFVSGGANVTNACLRGLVFTSFRESVVSVTSPTALTVRDCRFLANGTRCDKSLSRAICLDMAGVVDVEGCEFTGNYRAAHLAVPSAASAGGTSVFRGCRFDRNFTSGLGACLRIESQTSLLAEDCEFTGNCENDQTDVGAAVVSYTGSGNVVMRRCLFRGNRTIASGYGALALKGQGAGSFSIEECNFAGNEARIDNTIPWSPSIYSHSPCIAILSGRMLARDSYFGGNSLVVSGDIVRANSYGAVCAARNQADAQFLNCTFDGNAVTNAAAQAPMAGVFATTGDKSSMAFANCLVNDSRIAGAAAECALSGGNGDTTFAMVNTVVRNASAGYEPFITDASPARRLSFADAAISGLDVAALAADAKGYLYDVSADPGPVSSARTGENGLPARGIAATSPYVLAGRPVWLAPDGYLYFRDEAASPDKPWRKIVRKTESAATVQGLDAETPPEPDAFGAPRSAGKIAYGPLNAPSGGTFLILR